MSTSYNSSASQSQKLDIESFEYVDDSGHSASETGLLDGARTDERSSKTVDVPRISDKELSRLLSEARNEGIGEGERRQRERFEVEIARLKQQFAELASSFQRERSEYFSKVEVELIHLALAIAARILHREAQVDRMVVAGLVKVMLEKLQQGTQVTVHVRPEDVSNWKNYLREIANLEVVEDAALAPGGCVLETELGMADMGMDAQLKEVETGFFDLLAQRPEAQ